MQHFLVGGALRNQLLGRAAKDRDWLTLDASEAEMEAAGFQRVGKSFPVFLHPESSEEHALPRPLRPGLELPDPAPEVAPALWRDLFQRDLTVNAMARDPAGNLIDPFNGQADLEAKILRHVSPAFADDPLRVLRTARFAAGYDGFSVAPETLDLCREITASGLLTPLPPERLWRETEKALLSDHPVRYFEILREMNALAALFPEIEALFDVPQSPEHHPEGCAGTHTLLVLEAAARMAPSGPVRWAALLHDLGKGVTPPEDLPRHIDHERRGLPLIEALCDRLAVPNDYRNLALLAGKVHLTVHRAPELKPGTLLKLLTDTDAFRRPDRFLDLLTVCRADKLGRGEKSPETYPAAPYLERILAAAAAVETAPLLESGLTGEAFAEALRIRRLGAISAEKSRLKAAMKSSVT